MSTPSNRIHFGSISAIQDADTTMKTPSGISFETLESTQDEKMLSEQTRSILNDLERKKKAKQLVIPTNDAQVRILLRKLDAPQAMFGEGGYERRERLRHILSSLNQRFVATFLQNTQEDDESDESDEEFFTRGGELLECSRRELARFSMERAQIRLGKQREGAKLPLPQVKSERKDLYKHVKTMELDGTQVGGDRPLSFCTFSGSGTALATGGFGGEVKLWSVPNCNPLKTFAGHRERVGGIAFHPSHGHHIEIFNDAESGEDLGQKDQMCTEEYSSTVQFASGAADGSIYLWNCNSYQPIRKLEGHPLRVSRVAFHPSGRYLGSTSHDMSWRLWDIVTGQELLLQEGHSREVYAIAFQTDGALAATGGLDCLGRIWDLRSGKSVMLLEGHTHYLLGLSFSPSGHEIASCSEDNTVRIHDVRMLKASKKIIFAHKGVVSQVVFRQVDTYASASPSSTFGDLMVTSGYDSCAKVWGVGDWRELRQLNGHEGRVMSVDITSGLMEPPAYFV